MKSKRRRRRRKIVLANYSRARTLQTDKRKKITKKITNKITNKPQELYKNQCINTCSNQKRWQMNLLDKGMGYTELSEDNKQFCLTNAKNTE